MRPVILPGSARRHPFAGGDRRCVAKDGHKVLLPSYFDAKDTKAVFLIVKRHPFHEPGKNLLFVG